MTRGEEHVLLNPTHQKIHRYRKPSPDITEFQSASANQAWSDDNPLPFSQSLIPSKKALRSTKKSFESASNILREHQFRISSITNYTHILM